MKVCVYGCLCVCAFLYVYVYERLVCGVWNAFWRWFIFVSTIINTRLFSYLLFFSSLVKGAHVSCASRSTWHCCKGIFKSIFSYDYDHYHLVCILDEFVCVANKYELGIFIGNMEITQCCFTKFTIMIIITIILYFERSYFKTSLFFYCKKLLASTHI